MILISYLSLRGPLSYYRMRCRPESDFQFHTPLSTLPDEKSRQIKSLGIIYISILQGLKTRRFSLFKSLTITRL